MEKLVGIVGAGTMGSGIAIASIRAGVRTLLWDTNAEQLEVDVDGLEPRHVRRTAHEVRRAVGGGVRPEQHAVRADLVEKPLHLARTAPRRLQVQIRQLLRMPARPAPPLQRPEIGVVKDEADARKPLGQPADQVRVRRARGSDSDVRPALRPFILRCDALSIGD